MKTIEWILETLTKKQRTAVVKHILNDDSDSSHSLQVSETSLLTTSSGVKESLHNTGSSVQDDLSAAQQLHKDANILKRSCMALANVQIDAIEVSIWHSKFL
jgi:hypothetical protein